MRTIAFVAHQGNLGLATRNSEILARLRRYGKISEVYHRSKLDLVKGLQKQRRLQMMWPPFAVGIDLMINSIVAQLCALRRRPDFVHAETSPMGYAALLYSRESGVPYVLDLHGLWTAEHLGRVEERSKPPGRQHVPVLAHLHTMEREAALHAYRLLVVSRAMKAHVIESWGVPASRVHVVPNGGFLSPKRAAFSPAPHIVYGGIIAYWERWQDFVEMSRFWGGAGPKFLMLGGGPDTRMLRRQLKVLRSANLSYLGMRSRGDALALFSQCQIGVAPSSDDLARRVAWPIKVMDYMSLGLPVIAPMVGDWGRMIRDRKAGVVTAQSDPREFCEAAKVLCDEREWTHASKNALETIRSDYLWSQVLEPLDDVYA